MDPETRTPPGESLADLMKGTLGDVEKLIGHHIDLLRTELKDEVCKAKSAALSLAGGAGIAAAGGLLGILALVHGLHEKSRLPLWACYGLVGGVLGGAGAALLRAGARQAADVQVVPRRTAEVFREEFAG